MLNKPHIYASFAQFLGGKKIGPNNGQQQSLNETSTPVFNQPNSQRGRREPNIHTTLYPFPQLERYEVRGRRRNETADCKSSL